MIRVYERKLITELYARHRPAYSAQLIKSIMGFCNRNNPQIGKQHDLLLDVACGSGQATRQFAPYFKRLLGVDVSSNQIRLAKHHNTHDNIFYEEGCAESLPEQDNSVDLVVSATACHRFQLDVFFSEVLRVLKLRGCLALFAYQPPSLNPICVSNHSVRESLAKESSDLFYEFCQVKTDAVTNHHIDSKYADIVEMLPFKVKVHITENLNHTLEWKLDDVIGYYKSLAAYHESMRLKSAKENDFAETLRTTLKKSWGVMNKADKDVSVVVDFPIFLVMGSGKKSQ